MLGRMPRALWRSSGPSMYGDDRSKHLAVLYPQAQFHVFAGFQFCQVLDVFQVSVIWSACFKSFFFSYPNPAFYYEFSGFFEMERGQIERIIRIIACYIGIDAGQCVETESFFLFVFVGNLDIGLGRMVCVIDVCTKSTGLRSP